MRGNDYNGVAMKKKRACFFLLLIGLGVGIQTGWGDDYSLPKVVTSIFPLAEFAREICGDRAEIEMMLPPGAEVHTWQPRPSDIVNLSQADLLIYIGKDLEPWMHDILRSVKNPDLVVLEVSKNIQLRREYSHQHDKQHHHSEQEGIDPHIWLDFDLVLNIIDQIVDVLSQSDPENAGYFQTRASAYKEKIKVLDQKYFKDLRDCRQRTFIFGGHAAFGYLAKRYNLHQVALYGLSPDSRPTPKQLMEVVDLAKKYKIEVIYFESYVSNELAKVIAKEIGVRTSILYSGSNLTTSQIKEKTTFLELMEKNLENLKNGLLCK